MIPGFPTLHGLQLVLYRFPRRLSLAQLFDILAGHYASKDWKDRNGVSRPRLLRPSDVTKDQTYYLSSIPEHSLARALFPLGNLKKVEVRELATKWNLPTAAREESMGICFIGEKRKFHNFICESLVTLIVV
jgi:tRNA U34 2-thiouridine synthase MnmA/TrmU